MELNLGILSLLWLYHLGHTVSSNTRVPQMTGRCSTIPRHCVVLFFNSFLCLFYMVCMSILSAYM